MGMLFGSEVLMSLNYKTGVFVGKFIPPHRGHINSIIDSATQCEMLYVVVSDHPQLTERLCKESNIPVMDGILRTKWLSQEPRI